MVSQEVINGCKKKDRKAQEVLYKSCYGYLMGVCRRYYKNNDDAESILNQAYLKILTNIKKYREDVPFRLWARRVTINTIFDEFRKQKRYREAMVITDNTSDEYSSASIAFNEGDQKMDAEALFALLDELPDVSRKVFSLHAIDGYPHREIGELMNISVGTSKWHVGNARKKLMELMTKKNLVLKAV